MAIPSADARGREHEAGAIHRDLKQANIAAGAYGRAEAPDSGLAERTERRQGEDESTAKAPLPRRA